MNSFNSCQQQFELKLSCSLVARCSNPVGLFHEYILLLGILIQSHNVGKKKKEKERKYITACSIQSPLVDL